MECFLVITVLSSLGGIVGGIFMVVFGAKSSTPHSNNSLVTCGLIISIVSAMLLVYLVCKFGKEVCAAFGKCCQMFPNCDGCDMDCGDVDCRHHNCDCHCDCDFND